MAAAQRAEERNALHHVASTRALCPLPAAGRGPVSGVPVKKPRALKSGDRIAVVSPASPFAVQEFEQGIAELRRLGFDPVYDESVFERSVFTSGPAEARAAAFVRAWSEPSVAALIAVRGGYGSVQLLPELATWEPERTPKMFIAYSDNTSLLSWLTTKRGIAALHGPMLEGRLAGGPGNYDEVSFMRLLQGDGAGFEMRPEGLDTLKAGEAAGPLFGGTMTQLAASLGTPFAFDPPPGSILFFEDVNERPYKIDRLLVQLRLSGILARARALVFGEMRGCDEPNGEVTARGVIATATADFPGPVLIGFPSGHTTGPCWTLPLGTSVRVKGGPHPALIVEESPVE
jgi:muramoyltetrapeptide carboxypeptidase